MITPKRIDPTVLIVLMIKITIQSGNIFNEYHIKRPPTIPIPTLNIKVAFNIKFGIEKDDI